MLSIIVAGASFIVYVILSSFGRSISGSSIGRFSIDSCACCASFSCCAILELLAPFFSFLSFLSAAGGASVKNAFFPFRAGLCASASSFFSPSAASGFSFLALGLKILYSISSLAEFLTSITNYLLNSSLSSFSSWIFTCLSSCCSCSFSSSMLDWSFLR